MTVSPAALARIAIVEALNLGERVVAAEALQGASNELTRWSGMTDTWAPGGRTRQLSMHFIPQPRFAPAQVASSGALLHEAGRILVDGATRTADPVGAREALAVQRAAASLDRLAAEISAGKRSGELSGGTVDTLRGWHEALKSSFATQGAATSEPRAALGPAADSMAAYREHLLGTVVKPGEISYPSGAPLMMPEGGQGYRLVPFPEPTAEQLRAAKVVIHPNRAER